MKRLTLLLTLLLFSASAYAGYDLLFCTNADSLGNCKEAGNTFEWNGDKTYLQLIVLNKDTITTNRLKFKLYAMSNDREGTLYADLSVAVPPNALYAVKKMYFYKPGYYKVEVLDDKDGKLTSGFVTISERRD
ncbi:MAG TPA: hypothetical protein PLW44_05615 [Chitinophagales bacterium]|nr:hypothetical protein [Chitinophagales bacterium]